MNSQILCWSKLSTEKWFCKWGLNKTYTTSVCIWFSIYCNTHVTSCPLVMLTISNAYFYNCNATHPIQQYSASIYLYFSFFGYTCPCTSYELFKFFLANEQTFVVIFYTVVMFYTLICVLFLIIKFLWLL